MQAPVPTTIEFSRMFIIARETRTRLDILTARVREGRDLMAAKEFVAYLQWSGLIKLIEHCEQPEALPVNGALIKHTMKELESLVNEQLASVKPETSVSLTELEKINHRLDLIAAHVAKFG